MTEPKPLQRDLTHPTTLKTKGLLFGLLGLIATGLIIVRHLEWQTIALLAIAIWAWCRFYYFLFYVLENYAGRKRPYAGIIDLMMSIFRE